MEGIIQRFLKFHLDTIFAFCEFHFPFFSSQELKHAKSVVGFFFLNSTESFQSSDRQPCKFTATKGSVYITIVVKWHRTVGPNKSLKKVGERAHRNECQRNIRFC